MDSGADARRRFTFRQTLGRGGFGEVYLAEMTAPSGLVAVVAVKVLHGGLDPRSQAVQRLKDEARILSMLHHPAIVGVHDLAILDGRIAMVTEFVEGADLPDCQTGPDPLPVGAVLEAWAQVAGALDAAHNATDPAGNPLRLLHRDVKPRNVRIGRHGQVKLLDFGIATGTGFDRDANTQTGALIGSFPYVGPERFKRGAIPTPASDVYSLGCSLAESLRGELVFTSDDVAGFVATKLDRTEHDGRIAEFLAPLTGVPDGTRELLTELMAFDPTQRPSCADLIPRLEDLATAAGGPRLARWARSRSWPEIGTAESGPLSGLSLVDSPSNTSETMHVGLHDTDEPSLPSAVRDRAPIAAPAPPPRPPIAAPVPAEAAPGGAWKWIAGVGLLGLLVAGGSVILASVAGAAGVWALGSTTTTTPPQPVPVPAPVPAPVGDTDVDVDTDPGGDTDPVRDTDDASAAVDPPEPGPGPDGTVGVRPDPQPPQPLSAADAGACADLAALEPRAVLGTLNGGERACLAAGMRDVSARMTDRQKAGMVLLNDELARCTAGSCTDYERDQVYYLEEVGQSDPDLMSRWANHLLTRNRNAEARVWIRKALDEKGVWSGKTRASRVDDLYKWDALAARAMWEGDRKNEDLRLEARDTAVTWANWRSQIVRDTKPPMELCASAEGSMDACLARVHDDAVAIQITVVSLPPGLDVKVGGESRGATPVKLDLKLGTHTVVVAGPYGPVEHSFDVGIGKHTRWTLDAETSRWTSAP